MAASLPSVHPAVMGAMSLRQVKLFKPAEGQEPSARLTDGGVYFGDLDDQRRPHGRGIAILGDGVSRYGGEWREGHYHGLGSMVASTFDYEGAWDMDEMHGFGTIHYKDTVVSILLRGVQLLSPFDATHKPLEYRGDFHKTYHRHGKGTMTYRNGDVYEGEWASNRRNNFGTMRYVSGESYSGQWRDDERQGEGVLQLVNGSVFRGTFERDKRHGEKCQFTFPSGDDYCGAFYNDDITGFGVMRYKNGDVYEGMWRDGVRHGKGKFELRKRGATIEGIFDRGLIDGEATVTFPGKSKYIGTFHKGEKVFGTLFNDAESSCYQGEWRSDTMHGQGLHWYSNGDFYYGKFNNSKRDGYGNCTYVDGKEYSGEWADDKRHGKGLLQNPDGSIIAGRWDQDSFVGGYQGEWDGIHFNGIGTLQVDGGSQYFGIFKDGQRDGMGIMSIGVERCNAAALASRQQFSHPKPDIKTRSRAGSQAETLQSVPSEAGALAPPSDVAMSIFGCWKKDVLNGPIAHIRYPGGEVYEGPCVNGLRDTAHQVAAIIQTPHGTEYLGAMRRDGQDGVGSVLVVKDPTKPVFAPLSKEEREQELAWEVEFHRSESERQRSKTGKDSSSILDMLNPMNMFRSRNDSAGSCQVIEPKKVPRRIVGYETDYTMVGSWRSAERDEQLVSVTGANLPHLSVPLVGGGKGVAASEMQSRAATGVLTSSTSSKKSAASSNSAAAIPSFTTYNTGLACGEQTIFYREGSVFRGEFCENRQVLFLPHRSDANLPAPPQGPRLIHTQPRPSSLDTLPKGDRNCMHCKKEFGMFRKPTPCDCCKLNSCSSCLSDVAPISYDKSGLLMARIASLFFDSSKRQEAEVAAVPFQLKSKSAVCPACCSAVSYQFTWGTYWSRQSDDDLMVFRGSLAGSNAQGDGELWSGEVAYYCGSFVMGKREGHGQQVFVNGESYTGGWHEDMRHGVGLYRFTNGSSMIGLWREGVLTELRFHGDVNADGERHGRGLSFDVDGGRFNGEWQHDKREGSGILQSADGRVYSGSFVNDNFHGIGKEVHADSVFMGSFEFGSRHGPGVERFGDRILVGTWTSGILTGHVRLFDALREDVYDAVYDSGCERRDIFLPQPMLDDTHALHCHRCHAEFGFFLRKHHCRLCGHVFCDDCSKQKSILPRHFALGGAQRVCDWCFESLKIGQSIGVHRYASGAVYCGLWSAGAWCSSGLYCKPDGTVYLLNSYRGAQGVSAVSTPVATPRVDVQPSEAPTPTKHSCDFNLAQPATESSYFRDPPPKTEECHRHLPANASLPTASPEDIESFKQWWSRLVEACGVTDLPLTFETAASIEQPRWNPTVPLNVFATNDTEDDTNERRRGSFSRAVIPLRPELPTLPETYPRAHEDVNCRKLRWGDESVRMEAITNERIERFMPFPPPDEYVGATAPPDELEEFDSVSVCEAEYRQLRCYSRAKINAETPQRPPHHTNTITPWSQWSCYPLPEYKGAAGTPQEPYFKTIPLITAPDCGKRSVQVAPLDGPLVLEVNSTRNGVDVKQSYAILERAL